MVMKRFEITEKLYLSKALLKMAGEVVHTPHSPPPPGSAPGPWYATKPLFASFASAIFRKICRGFPMAKCINMVWGPHIARVKTKNILNLRIGLFKASLSYVE